MKRRPICLFDVISGRIIHLGGTIDDLYAAADELRSLAFGLDYITVETYFDFLDDKFDSDSKAFKKSVWWRNGFANAKLKTDRIMVHPMWHPEWQEILYTLYR